MRTLHIGIDAHTVGHRRSGDERYTLGLIGGLARIDTGNNYFLYVTSDTAEQLLGPLPDNFVVRRVRPHQRHTRILLSYPLALRRDRLDVAHFQYIAPPFLSASLVLTVHDVSFAAFPQYFRPMERLALGWLTPLCLRRATKIVTVSEFSKREIMQRYGVPEEKVAVTHNAVADDYSPAEGSEQASASCRRLGVEKDFILWVGNLIRRKRPDMVLQAFADYVSRGDTGCDLVFVGEKRGLYAELRESARRAGLESRVKFLGYVPSNDLLHLYQHASVFVFPSQYEGFGIPVLEAMSCGTPVVCSSEASLAEVVGDAALTLPNPTGAGLAEAMREVLGNPSLREALRAKGLHRAESFSWDETARRTLAVYEESAAVSGSR